MPRVQHPTALWPCTLYILVLSYSVSPTVWGHDNSAHWPNCMTTHHWLWVFCVCKVTLQLRWWHPITAVSCVYTGHMRSPGHSLWGTAAGLGKVRVLVQDSVATAGSCCCCWGVLVVAALSHSSATTELRCTHTLQQGETSTATATLHIGSYVAKYFKQILQPVSKQKQMPLIMTAF